MAKRDPSPPKPKKTKSKSADVGTVELPPPPSEALVQPLASRPARVHAARIAASELSELLVNGQSMSQRDLVIVVRDAHKRVEHIRSLLGL